MPCAILAPVILLLAGASEADGRVSPRAMSPSGKTQAGYFMVIAKPHVAVDPFHGAAFFDDSALGDQVETFVVPGCRVANACVLLHENFNDAGVQKFSS